MLRISRLADYATTVMTILASREKCFSAAQVAWATPLSMATANKVLKLLNESKLVNSERGINGGYQLARPPEAIRIAEIVTVIDGNPAMTKCSQSESQCEHCTVCGLRKNWRLINKLVFEVLDSLSLSDMKNY
ncbi:MAG: SUF system Fe-S cluster assembly regulator [Coxiella endosymbiont of Haemaphysalis qinghaiensis]